MKNEFQYRLQKAIAEKGISASELSRLSGVNKVAISNYINGVYVAKQDKIYLLAKALDVDPGWLMTGEEPTTRQILERAFEEAKEEQSAKAPKTIEARILAEGVDKLPEDQRQRALAAFRILFEPQYEHLFTKGTDEDET